MIKTTQLTRVYRFKEKEPGFKGAVRHLFAPIKREKTAVREFDITIEEGEIIGLIGPNGAGKTTLIKMLTGIIPPSSGEVSVCGFTPSRLKDEFRKSYAVVMGQKSQLWWDLPASDSFALNKEMYRIPDDVFNRNVKELTEIFNMGDFLNKQVRQLSLGQRMKMEIIAALLHDPKVIFLDEPTIGLDGPAQKQIRSLLKRVNEERKTTIILTSHYMEDIKNVCEKVVVINEGVKVYEGSYRDLVNRVSPIKIVEITFDSPVEGEPDLGGEILERSPYQVKMKVDRDRIKSTVSSIFTTYDVADIAIEEEDIADVVEKIYNPA